MPHSCDVPDVGEHFAGAQPALREAFDALLAAARRSGPVTVNVTRSRIAFQDQIRFAGIDRPRRDHLVVNFVLTRPARSARLMRVDYVPPYYYVHRLRIAGREDVDSELATWLAEATRSAAAPT